MFALQLNDFFLKINATLATTHAACKLNGNRAMLESITTPLVVRDIERIAESLGEDGVNFWGLVICYGLCSKLIVDCYVGSRQAYGLRRRD